MKAHTNNFKNEISKAGKQISGRLYHYLNYNLISEDDNTLITEDNIQLISEQINPSDKELIDEELIYSISFVKNGQLLQSLMKELDFEAKYNLKIGDMINAQFGVLVENDYEYLDYGNYIIYSKKYSAENQTWQYLCYDKMLYSMVQYKPLDVIYPIAITEYIEAIANRIGLEFANSYSKTQDEFPNFDQLVQKELFEGQNITYRDILDKLSEITASNIFINDNDELELGYVNETNDNIDEENLKDINVNFGEIFGPINKIAITETDGGYEYPAENSQSIEANGLTQVNIIDNIFAFNGHSEEIAQNILNKLNGLYYSINDFSTTGVCYYDYLDLFNVSIGNNIYKCLLLNNEIKINQGLEEKIYTDKLENAEKESNNFKTSVINNKQVQFQINKQKGEIEARVEKNGIINAINLSEEGASINAEKISLKGKTIDMTSDNIKINSTNFNVDESGNCTANSFTSNDATITGGTLNMEITSGQKAVWLHSGSNETFINDLNYVATSANQECWVGAYTISGGINQYGFYVYDKSDNTTYADLWLKNGNPTLSVVSQGTGYALTANSGVVMVSDKRLKENIKYIDYKKSLNIIKDLKPIEFNYIKKERKHRGLIAQDVKETLEKNNIKDEIYDYDNEKDIYALNYTELIPDLINCVKYQQKQIETLQKQIQDLERKIK